MYVSPHQTIGFNDLLCTSCFVLHSKFFEIQKTRNRAQTIEHTSGQIEIRSSHRLKGAKVQNRRQKYMYAVCAYKCRIVEYSPYSVDSRYGCTSIRLHIRLHRIHVHNAYKICSRCEWCAVLM